MSIRTFCFENKDGVRSVPGAVPAVDALCWTREWEVSSSRDKAGIISQLKKLIGDNDDEYDFLRQRAELVVDEMLENALYSAPRDSNGSPLFVKGSARELLPAETICLRCNFDGTQLLIEVRDSWGNLSLETVENFLSMNLNETDPVCDRNGRGLFIMWKLLDYFYVDVNPELETTIGGVLNLSTGIAE